MKGTVLCVLLSVLLMQGEGHMWLLTPLSRGGNENAGGRSGPCSGKAAGSGEVTTFEAGDKVTFQFRVNQHGPAPFKFAFSKSGDNFDTIIKDNIVKVITAGPDGFNGVNVEVTIPDEVCDNCAVQLSGMGENDGSGRWYNCADVKIVPKGSLTAPKPALVTPATGPTTGGTKVSVTGTRFGATSVDTMKCRFGQTVVPATWVSDTEVSCVSPPYNQATNLALEVSRDGEGFSATGTTFDYTGELILPEISKISPRSGMPGTEITITGSNFFSTSMSCKFVSFVSADEAKEFRVPAEAKNEKEATCTVPNEEGLSGSLQVSVNVDGSPFSEKNAKFSIGAGLSGGQVAGIVIGVLVIVGLVAGVVALVALKKIDFKGQVTPSAWRSNRV